MNITINTLSIAIHIFLGLDLSTDLMGPIYLLASTYARATLIWYATYILKCLCNYAYLQCLKEYHYVYHT